jgi:hypothetical protein
MTLEFLHDYYEGSMKVFCSQYVEWMHITR